MSLDPNEIYKSASGIYPMKLEGQFEDSKFIGKIYTIAKAPGAHCRAAVYMARAPLTLDELARQEREKLYGSETGVEARPTATRKEAAAVAGAPVRPEAPFDGAWKGKLVADNSFVLLCDFRENYFYATVKDNRFVAVIDQEGNKRKFEGTIEKSGKAIIWGLWELLRKTRYNAGTMAVSGVFSGSAFKGKYTVSGSGNFGVWCNGAAYMARAPLTVAEVEQQEKMEALGEGTWVKMRPVAELKKLIEAADAAERASRRQAPGVRQSTPARLQAKER